MADSIGSCSRVIFISDSTGTRLDGRIAPGTENSSYIGMDTVVAVH
jgi:hypothetical protein